MDMHMTAHNGIQVTSVIVIPVPFEIYQISRIRIKAKHFHLLIVCKVAQLLVTKLQI